jgi:YHS domain-containing protein
MKKVMLLSAVIFAGVSGLAYAEDMAAAPVKMEMKAEMGEVKALPAEMAEEAAAVVSDVTVVNAGNKICPVQGNPAAENHAVTVEYKGKAYNLCCPMCKEAFLKDPEMFVKKVEAELAAAVK